MVKKVGLERVDPRVNSKAIHRSTSPIRIGNASIQSVYKGVVATSLYLGQFDEQLDGTGDIYFRQWAGDGSFADRFDRRQKGRLELLLIGQTHRREKREENVQHLAQPGVVGSQRMEEENHQPREYHRRFNSTNI